MADEPKRKLGTGALRAAGRQGFDEIGQALKAFPESIQSQEPGTLFNPTQGEIAETNRGSSLQSRLQDGRDRAEARNEPQPGRDRD